MVTMASFVAVCALAFVFARQVSRERRDQTSDQSECGRLF